MWSTICRLTRKKRTFPPSVYPPKALSRIVINLFPRSRLPSIDVILDINFLAFLPSGETLRFGGFEIEIRVLSKYKKRKRRINFCLFCLLPLLEGKQKSISEIEICFLSVEMMLTKNKATFMMSHSISFLRRFCDEISGGLSFFCRPQHDNLRKNRCRMTNQSEEQRAFGWEFI